MLSNKKYDAIIFDLDGTILNTLGTYTHLMNIILKENNLPIHSSEMFKSFIGNGAKNFVTKSIPKEKRTEEFIDKLLDNFNRLYETNYKITSIPYKNIVELLKKLESQNIKLSVLSNKLHHLTRKCVSHFFEDVDFKYVLGQSNKYKKPKPNGVLDIITKLNIPLNKIVLIGDTEVDIKTAKNAGIDSIAVTWGFRQKSNLSLSSPSYIVDNIKQLEKLLF